MYIYMYIMGLNLDIINHWSQVRKIMGMNLDIINHWSQFGKHKKSTTSFWFYHSRELVLPYEDLINLAKLELIAGSTTLWWGLICTLFEVKRSKSHDKFIAVILLIR